MTIIKTTERNELIIQINYANKIDKRISKLKKIESAIIVAMAKRNLKEGARKC